ncbi:MAG: ABC transporter ATP-binding protein [Bacteroidetes bacterium 43-93]|nr:ATP-binding cassette domain-containing protein [Bacteroidota bacterium]OJX01695.1 MAG: ABC transporter ATP-binding protein [Bacteroidetes bacterium 43-93]
MDTRENIANTTDAVISIRGVYKAFGSNKVLDDFNMNLQRGQSKVVLGRSGSGKSVLIKCIIGLLTPEAGTINVFGQNVLNMSQEQLDVIRVKIGFLFQSNALYDSMTVRENLEFPMRRHSIKLSEKEANERVVEALKNVGLEHTIDMMPSELSGGMKKRIALARTLILKPDIILYDEPTTGLDPITGREITTLIKEIQHKYQTSSIIISHDMKCVKNTADSIALLLNGKCYTEGTYSELAISDDPNVKQFFE